MIFLRKDEILAIHERAIRVFGGSDGLRDEGLLESAIVAAENRYFYERAGVAVCAATYAFHLVRAHAFVDGNKRVAVAAADAFLRANGAHLPATDDELYDLFLGLAAGDVSRDELTEWFTRVRLTRQD
jgi:death-on-curing protein